MYREQHTRTLCKVCSLPAGYCCLRCEIPFCAEHTPEGLRRCDGCEVDFEVRALALRSKADKLRAQDHRGLRTTAKVLGIGVAILGLYVLASGSYWLFLMAGVPFFAIRLLSDPEDVLRGLPVSRSHFLMERPYKRPWWRRLLGLGRRRSRSDGAR